MMIGTSQSFLNTIFQKKIQVSVRDRIWTQQFKTVYLSSVSVYCGGLPGEKLQYILRHARMRHLSLWQQHGDGTVIASSSCGSISARLLQHAATRITWNRSQDRKFIREKASQHGSSILLRLSSLHMALPHRR